MQEHIPVSMVHSLHSNFEKNIIHGMSHLNQYYREDLHVSSKVRSDGSQCWLLIGRVTS